MVLLKMFAGGFIVSHTGLKYVDCYHLVVPAVAQYASLRQASLSAKESEHCYSRVVSFML
jgi:hypothetical protein